MINKSQYPMLLVEIAKFEFSVAVILYFAIFKTFKIGQLNAPLFVVEYGHKLSQP